MVGKLIQLDGVNNMKSYEIWKENVFISNIYNATTDDYEWTIIEGYEYSEAFQVGKITEEELKNLKVLNANEIANLKVRDYLGRENIDDTSFKETCNIQSRKFEVYIIWGWKEEKVIGYLEDFK